MGKWFILIGLLLLICVAEWMREIFTFRTTHYSVASSKLNGLDKECKIVFLSDLHNNTYGRKNQKLLQAVADANPDFIFVGGDMLIGKPQVPYQVAVEFVQQLTTIGPVYYANGNHEFRMKINPEVYGEAYEKYKASLEQAGVTFLENTHIDIEWHNKVMQVYGLEIPREGYKKFTKANISLDEIEDRIGAPEQDKLQILLAHNPIYMEVYSAWGADVVLSGHIHGGVVRVPFLGGIISPQFRLFPRYSGEYKRIGDTSAIVSKGLGTHTLKVRFLNPAEVVVLHMKGKDK